MKKYLLFLFSIGFAPALFAQTSCPSGWTPQADYAVIGDSANCNILGANYVETDEIKIVANGTPCGDGYVEADMPENMIGYCDPNIGTCADNYDFSCTVQ